VTLLSVPSIRTIKNAAESIKLTSEIYITKQNKTLKPNYNLEKKIIGKDNLQLAKSNSFNIEVIYLKIVSFANTKNARDCSL
jgi:hypothetical protein